VDEATYPAVLNAAAGHWVIVTTETGAGPHEGEFCKLDDVISAAGTTTLECEQQLSAAPVDTTTIEISDPINIQPTFPADEDRNLTILCDGSGFGRGAATDSSIVMEIDGTSTAHDHGIRFEGCTLGGNDTAASNYEISLIVSELNASNRIYFNDIVTANLKDLDASATHASLDGDRFLVVDALTAAIGPSIFINGSFIDAALPFQFLNHINMLSIQGGSTGTSGPADDREFGCLYAGNYLGTAQANYMDGQYDLDTFWQSCRWFHFGDGPSVSMAGTWFWPSSVFDHAHSAPIAGWINSFGGFYEFDDLKIEQNVADLTLPESPFITLADDSGTPMEFSLSGRVYDPSCLISRTAGNFFLIGSDAAADGADTAYFSYIQGPQCQGVGDFDFLNVAAMDNVDDSVGNVDLHFFSRDDALHITEAVTNSHSQRFKEVDSTAAADDGEDFSILVSYPGTGPTVTVAGTALSIGPDFSMIDPGTGGTGTYSFFDTGNGFDGVQTNYICPADDNCSMRVAVNSGASGPTNVVRMFAIETAGDASVVQMGDIVTGTYVGVSEAGLMSFTGAGAGILIPNGADPAATCTVGELFMDTNTAADTNCTTSFDGAICRCKATNTWQGE
jgi:hypothetical protein